MFTGYILVVDTDQYSGNFERQMCAYMTGRMRDGDTTGAAMARRFRERYGVGVSGLGNRIYHLVTQAVDDSDDEPYYLSPVRIWPTPGWFNNGYGGHYRDGEEERARTDREAYIRKNYSGDEAESLLTYSMNKFPAYNSVAIFLRTKPTREDVDFLKARALEYAELVRPSIDSEIREYDQCVINVTGVRVVKMEEREVDV